MAIGLAMCKRIAQCPDTVSVIKQVARQRQVLPRQLYHSVKSSSFLLRHGTFEFLAECLLYHGSCEQYCSDKVTRNEALPCFLHHVKDSHITQHGARIRDVLS